MVYPAKTHTHFMALLAPLLVARLAALFVMH
jgi:hypothetical protein